jgi:hypothetical protein
VAGGHISFLVSNGLSREWKMIARIRTALGVVMCLLALLLVVANLAVPPSFAQHISDSNNVPRATRIQHDYEIMEEWLRTIDRTVEYEDLVKLKFSPRYFVEHLANKRIAFIGDSVTRYQYIALVYALSTGHFLNASLIPNPVEERTWPSWLSFYAGTLQPMEWCDCFRDQNHTTYQNENRYYFDNVRNISIVYLSTLTGLGCFGHWSDWGKWFILCDYDSLETNLALRR